MIDKLAPLFYGEKLTRLEWKVLKAIAKTPEGGLWIQPRPISNDVAAAMRTLIDLKMIGRNGIVGVVYTNNWRHSWFPTDLGRECVRLLTDPERHQVFPAWGKSGMVMERLAA